MKLAPREIALGITTLAAGLFALTLSLAKPQIDKWKELRGQCEQLKHLIDSNKALIQEKDSWAAQLSEQGNQLESFPADRQMDVYWLSVMDRIAAANNVLITRRQAGEVTQDGNVYELPIECKEWSADLPSLVRFLFDLQSQGAMLDVRLLNIKPHKEGTLRGRFELYCAYTKDDVSATVAPKSVPENPSAAELSPPPTP
jgi:hypothetical protein